MKKRSTWARAGTLLLSLGTAVSVLAGPAAVAAKDGDVIHRSSCTSRSDWKLKLSPENGRLEVEFEVDQNRNGRVWNVRMKRNGNRIWRGQRTTRPPSGSFRVRRLTRNGNGADRIVVRARDLRSGEVCRGVATFRG